jgi:putative membrane protein
LPKVAEGVLFGLAVWGGSYLGLLPGTGLYRSAKDEAPERNALMIAAHIIWGASLGVLVDNLIEDEPS